MGVLTELLVEVSCFLVSSSNWQMSANKASKSGSSASAPSNHVLCWMGENGGKGEEEEEERRRGGW